MPINYRLLSKANGNKEIFPFIMPGEARAIPSYLGSKKETLILHCLPHDLGGKVYSSDIDAYHNDLIPPHLLDEKEEIEFIPPGGSYSTEIVTKKRKRYMLLARHIGRYASLTSLGEQHQTSLPEHWDYLKE